MKILLIILTALMTAGCGGVHTLSGDDRERMVRALQENETIVLIVLDADEQQDLHGSK